MTYKKALITVSALLSHRLYGADSFSPSFTHRSFYSRSDPVATSSRPAFASPVEPATHTSHHEIDTSRRYSETLDRQIPPGSSFEDRMRKIVHGKPSAATRSRKGNPMRPANVQEVFTLDEYKEAVADVQDKLVVVRFYAKWCKACRAVAPMFYKMAKEFENDAVFVEVPVTEDNANVHQGLGVPTIPFGHIYHPQGGLVEERRLVRRVFPRFLKVFRNYLLGSCELPEDGDCSDPYSDEVVTKQTAGAI